MMDSAYVLGALALIGSVTGAFLAFRGKKGETKISDDANLRDDQREFIAELRAEITGNRAEKIVEREARAKLEAEIESLRLEVHGLRLELQQTRADLESARLRAVSDTEPEGAPS